MLMLYSEDVYMSLRTAILGRIRDKETPVRIQAVIALAKIHKGEQEQEPDERGQGHPR